MISLSWGAKSPEFESEESIIALGYSHRSRPVT